MQLLDKIVANLQRPEFAEEMTSVFMRQLSSAIAAAATLKESTDAQRDELEAELAQLEKEISTLAEGFAKSGSEIILETIKLREPRRAAIKKLLSAKPPASGSKVDEKSIHSFLSQQFTSLAETLRADAETAKVQVAKLMDKKLVLTPEVRHGEVVLVVTGDLRLFAPNDAMLVQSVERMEEHYIDVRLSLNSLVLVPYSKGECAVASTRPSIVADQQTTALETEEPFVASEEMGPTPPLANGLDGFPLLMPPRSVSEIIAADQLAS